MARSMRTVVRQQLAAGETPAEIRTWFSARYGSSVLLDPPARGPGVLLVAGPALLLIAGGAFAVRAVRGPRPASVGSARRPPRRRTVGALALGAGVVAVGTAVTAALTWGGVRPGAPPSQQPAAAAEPQGSPSASAAPDSRVAQALARLKANDAAGAERLAQAVLKDDSGSPDALLVLGLAEREAGSTEAARTLQRFLAVAPSHPAAPEVRTYLQRLGATAR